MRKKKTNKPTLGQGGEIHQQAKNLLTTSQGVSISDNQNSLRVGSSGSSLLEDFHLRENLSF